MPFYDYKCKTCGQQFEKLSKTMPGPSILECPECQTLTATRQMSAFATTGLKKSGNAAGCAPSGGG